MKFTPEQVIEMAREAGGVEAVVGEFVLSEADLTRLCTLAADRALEAAYDVVMREPFKQQPLDTEEWDSPEAAHEAAIKSMAFDICTAIRAMKEHQ